MNRKFKILALSLSLIFSTGIVYSQESNPVFQERTNNEVERRLLRVEGGISLTSGVTGILPLANGGTNTLLTDPGADKLIFWDNSVSAFDWRPITHIEVITASDASWDVPSWVSIVYVTLIGGGGGGGASDSGGNIGGGGGSAGSYFINRPIAVTPGGTVAIVIGTGGAGGTANGEDGANGIDSVFNNVSAFRGSQGLGGAQTGGVCPSPDSGGIMGGFGVIKGGDGANGAGAAGGGGGGSPFGRGGDASANAIGEAGGVNTGAGGAAGSGTSAHFDGGDGGSGIAILMY